MSKFEIQDVLNTIICGDTLEIMKRLPDESIDLIVTSPPYNLKNSSAPSWNVGKRAMWKKAKIKEGYDSYNDNMPHEEYVQWQRDCLTEMMRLLPDDGAIFYNHKWRVQNKLLQDRHDIVSGFPVRQIIIWNRKAGINFNQTFFLPKYEVIYLITKPNFVLADKAFLYGDIWEIIPDMNNDHPAPFPVSLVNKCVTSTNAKVILDPFMGSGTTAISAIKHNRNYIGIELSPQYIEMAEQRIKQETSQKQHFDSLFS